MKDIKNIKLVLEYDGTRYHGWQRQKDDPTIQGEIEARIQILVGEPVTLIASGRTDAGVHALHQVCNFMTKSKMAIDDLKRGLNSLLPDDIQIKQAGYCPTDFHARYSAKSKTYEYRILNRQEPDIFYRSYRWHIQLDLRVEEIRGCLKLLLGKHDFSSFRSAGSGNLNPVREMIRAELHGPDQDILRFVFEADGFLRHMVRNIVGTLIEVGKGKMDLEEFLRVFKSRDRRMAGLKAPSRGLFLTMVRY